MGRTNIEIDDELIDAVMMRFHIKSKRAAVDYALRQLIGSPMTREEMLAMAGSLPDFKVPADVWFDDDDPA